MPIWGDAIEDQDQSRKWGSKNFKTREGFLRRRQLGEASPDEPPVQPKVVSEWKKLLGVFIRRLNYDKS